MEAADFCQSCAMPLEKGSDVCGTNADGSKNAEYCSYCFKDGHFTSEMSMEEMIGLCAPHMAAAHPGMTEEQAKGQMREFFPSLKRWAK